MQTTNPLTLVLGGTGKTGRRIVTRLEAAGRPVRVGSRAANPAFDWHRPDTWRAALAGVDAVYLAYYPDVAVPGAVDTVRAFVNQAVASGVQRLVLLSGRGEAEARRAEHVIQTSGLIWTILRCSWFAQNFSENFMVDAVRAGTLALPAGDVREPFLDVEDIADVAFAALTEDGHAGQLYELTGPRLLSFADAVNEIATATGRDIRYEQLSSEDYLDSLAAHGLSTDFAWLLNYLFTTVLDGRNASVTDGVQRALGREARDFSDYAQAAASTGVWQAS